MLLLVAATAWVLEKQPFEELKAASASHAYVSYQHPIPACPAAAVAGDLRSELLRRLVTPGELFPDMGAALAEMQVRAWLCISQAKWLY